MHPARMQQEARNLLRASLQEDASCYDAVGEDCVASRDDRVCSRDVGVAAEGGRSMVEHAAASSFLGPPSRERRRDDLNGWDIRYVWFSSDLLSKQIQSGRTRLCGFFFDRSAGLGCLEETYTYE
jgi:hypothetical protein